MLDVRISKQLDGFTLELAARSAARVLGVVGPSGAGKSTLLACIAGTQWPDAGVVRVRERVLFERQSVNVTAPKRRIGMVFQEMFLFPHLTVRENLRYGLGVHGPAPDFHEVVRLLELRDRLEHRADRVSGGEARRVAIGRALLSGPELLVLDEPLTGLDRPLAMRTLAYIRRTLERFGIPAVYVSHTVSDVLYLCDEVWALRAGRLAAAGPPRRVLFEQQTADTAGLESIFPARCVQRHEGGGAVFAVGGQRLHAAHCPPEVLGEALLSIPASDIILASQRPGPLSARNVLRGRVTQLVASGDTWIAFVDVGAGWMVELTRAAIEELDLREGAEVYAIVKASAVQVV